MILLPNDLTDHVSCWVIRNKTTARLYRCDLFNVEYVQRKAKQFPEDWWFSGHRGSMDITLLESVNGLKCNYVTEK